MFPDWRHGSPLPAQTGKVAKEHYSYEKNGYFCLLPSIEPLKGKRIAMLYAQRTRKEYTQFMQVIAENYPDAIKIKMVQNNLNTHNTSSFYEHLPADEAKSLADRFEFHHIPKSASWLTIRGKQHPFLMNKH